MHGHADLLDQVREEDRDNLWVTQIQAPGKYFHLFFLPYTAYAELKDVSEEDGEMEVRNFLKYVDTGEMWPRCIRAYGVSTLRKLQGYAYAVSYDDMIIMLKHMLKKTPKPAAQVLPNSDSAASASSAAEQMPRAPRPAAQAVPAAKQSEDEWSPLDMKDTVAKLSDAVKDLAKVLSSVTKENIRMAERRDSEELRKVKRERDEAIDETEQLRRDLLVKANISKHWRTARPWSCRGTCLQKQISAKNRRSARLTRSSCRGTWFSNQTSAKNRRGTNANLGVAPRACRDYHLGDRGTDCTRCWTSNLAISCDRTS